ncbi:MAG TPA: hydrolase [candidate division Zixibacteria bacterium]|nr:hydrolase [candidate division Zixibacteria bacterium]
MLIIDNAVLVVIDIQGKLATLMDKKEDFYEAASRMIRGCQILEIPILWNEQLPDKLGPTIDSIKELFPGQEPLVKKTFSCCGNEVFMTALKKTDRFQVLIVGMETHVCVWQTAQDLIEEGYEVYLVADAVSSRFKGNKRIAIEAMRDLGVNVTAVEQSLFEMLVTAEGDKFRQIIKLVK